MNVSAPNAGGENKGVNRMIAIERGFIAGGFPFQAVPHRWESLPGVRNLIGFSIAVCLETQGKRKCSCGDEFSRNVPVGSANQYVVRSEDQRKC